MKEMKKNLIYVIFFTFKINSLVLADDSHMATENGSSSDVIPAVPVEMPVAKPKEEESVKLHYLTNELIFDGNFSKWDDLLKNNPSAVKCVNQAEFPGVEKNAQIKRICLAATKEEIYLYYQLQDGSVFDNYVQLDNENPWKGNHYRYQLFVKSADKVKSGFRGFDYNEDGKLDFPIGTKGDDKFDFLVETTKAAGVGRQIMPMKLFAHTFATSKTDPKDETVFQNFGNSFDVQNASLGSIDEVKKNPLIKNQFQAGITWMAAQGANYQEDGKRCVVVVAVASEEKGNAKHAKTDPVRVCFE